MREEMQGRGAEIGCLPVVAAQKTASLGQSAGFGLSMGSPCTSGGLLQR